MGHDLFDCANAVTAGTANATTFGSSSVIRASTASAAATVIMFHANEQGAQGAFDAEQVLKQYSQRGWAETVEGGIIQLIIAHRDHWNDPRPYMTELRQSGVRLR